MTEDKNKGGRPLKFQSVEDLQKLIDAYFESCWDYKRDMFGNRLKDKETKTDDGKPAYIMQQVRPYTITGLANAIDTTRETLLDYESGKYDPEELEEEARVKFSDTIKRAKQHVHQYAEEQLYRPGLATGSIFNLKNNYGWKDVRDIESGGQPLRGSLFGDDVLRIEVINADAEDEPEASDSMDAS